MALTVCMNCDQTFLIQDKFCRHCGTPNPGVMGAARHLIAEFEREAHQQPPVIQQAPRKAFTFWNAYFEVVKVLWTSSWWYLFLGGTFVIGMGGHVNHPVRVGLGVLFIGLVFFPLLGYLYFLADRAATKRGFRL